MIWYIGIGVASAALGALIAVVVLRGMIENIREFWKGRVSSLEQQVNDFCDERNEATAAAQDAAVSLREAREEVRVAVGEAERSHELAASYRDTLQNCIDEANRARRLYLEAGAGHGAAQSMMLREREAVALAYLKLARLYREKTGEQAPPPPRNPNLDVVAAHFRDVHVPPDGSGPRSLGELPDPAALPPIPSSG